MTTTRSRADASSSGLSVRKDGRPPFRRILIANRGEIALRIIRTCADLGVETVAVYSDVDADAAHVRAAHVAVPIGSAAPSASYLRADAIIAAGLEHGAEAVHPGYGFLSERASFARAVIEAGMVWVGPRPDAIDALGDKLAARRTAVANDVPVVPGTFEAAAVDRPDELERVLEAAAAIGFPLLVKASAGGGGRGMRLVERAQDLPAALAAGSSEARAAFGDGAVYLERAISPARHIEVQLLGDAAGEVVAIGERDCSIQRRHQKLVEESPAPGLTHDERVELHAMAVRAARAAGLHNAATAEFLFDADRRPWFLEVNARLQVEHGVTELVTDLDLVEEQLWIAAGASLSPAVLAAAGRAADPTRHAIEVRLSAEDPSRGFAPTPGRLGRWVMPAGPGVRVDSAIEPGERVPPDYDPMIAKILTVGPDRPAAIARMRRALDEVVVTGIQTTLPFDRALFSDDGFVRGDTLAIHWVDRHWDGAGHRDARRATAAALARAAVADAEPATLQPPSLRTDSAVPTASPWTDAGRRDVTDRWPR